MQITKHAKSRMQQRGIRLEVIDLLLAFGEQVKTANNREILFFSRQARKFARGSQPEQEKLCKAKSPYIVVSEEMDVITVGHRTRKIKRF